MESQAPKCNDNNSQPDDPTTPSSIITTTTIVKLDEAENQSTMFEEMFASRYTDADEEYKKAAETVSSEPICIAPWPPQFQQQGRMPPPRGEQSRNFNDYDRRREEQWNDDGHGHWNRRNGNNFGSGEGNWRSRGGGGGWRGRGRGGRNFGQQQHWRGSGGQQRNFDNSNRFQPY